ncbi:UNVERIFIED_CONTAM: Deoxyuridine 5'-triphosphate nucleotidohydrolase [Trichonephila clavipes]
MDRYINTFNAHRASTSTIEALLDTPQIEEVPSSPLLQVLPSDDMSFLDDLDKFSEEETLAPPPNNHLKFKKLAYNAKLPTRGSPFSAGYDLYCTETFTIASKSRAKVGTGLAVELEPNEYGRICDRSSVALILGLHVIAGIIDADYRGQIYICIYNISEVPTRVVAGTPIAQLIVSKFESRAPQWYNELSSTERGEKGFGSTRIVKNVTTLAVPNSSPVGTSAAIPTIPLQRPVKVKKHADENKHKRSKK